MYKSVKLQNYLTAYAAMIFFSIIFLQNYVLAAWSASSQMNTAICTASGQQSAIQVISDGTGGAIIVWEDTRNVHFDIFAQRIDAKGNVMWEENGVPVCLAEENQKLPKIISDGAGGVIITWHDLRSGITNSDIYAQRIDVNGNPMWKTDGIPVCDEINEQDSPCIATDSAGGAIIIWQDSRTNYDDLYAQRINNNGEMLWEKNGVPVCWVFGAQSAPVTVDDGHGGAIVAWQDFRKSYADIYAQRIDGSGRILWEKTGVNVCGARGHESYPVIISNGAEGAIVAWMDMRNDNNDIFAQQLDGNGNILWEVDGIPVTTAQEKQDYPVMVTDGAGGAIIAWWDLRSGKYDVYTQRIDLTGNPLWKDDGLPVCMEDGIQNYVSLTADGVGGAILAWNDSRASLFDIYAQRIDSNGNAQWNNNGAPVSTASETQCYSAIVSDGKGGAIIVWQDERNTDKSYWDIYAQKINAAGLLGAQ
ncbi:MAG: hypothetical protein E3K37_02095 [Candidatus Kuenenia sp.]|nr:hypothetical protein [Candidatus Kuenenia hertensis]